MTVRRITRALAFVVVVSIASLVLLELGLRLLDPFYAAEFRERISFQGELLMPHPNGPTGGTVLRADHRAEFLGEEYVIGPHRMRSPAVPKIKPKGTYRVLVVGDSIAFGWGVAERDCFPRVLERILNAGGKPTGIDRFEVINGSCPGWGVPSYYLFTQDVGLAFDPDCVLVTFINNDLTDVISQLDPKPAAQFMELPHWCESFYTAQAIKAVHDISLGADGDFFLELSESDLTRPAIDALCDNGLRLLAELVAPRTFVVLDTVGTAEGKSLEHFASRLQQLGIARIEGFLPITNYAEEYAITPTDMHPNAKGHGEIAGKIYQWFERNVLR